MLTGPSPELVAPWGWRKGRERSAQETDVGTRMQGQTSSAHMQHLLTHNDEAHRVLNTSFKVAHTMTYELRPHPTPPTDDLRDRLEGERAIAGGPLWCLKTIQQKLAELKLVYSAKAQNDALTELVWSLETPKAFISQLSRGRYDGSQWCYTTKGTTPYPADAYCMGFNRHKGVENQRTDPWVYFKFSIIENTNSIVIFSAHPEKQNGR